MAEEPVVVARDVYRLYREGTAQEVAALRGVNLTLHRGRMVALKGRSGSGKTTLLNCIGGLDEPTRGEIVVFGQQMAALREPKRTHFRRERIGYIFQAFGLSPTLSAYENVELMLRMAGVSRAERRRRALDCLRLVGLERWAEHRPGELSGGQQQRVGIARSLANRPRLLLADEPTGKLDTETARDILALFREIVAEEALTLLMSSHDPLVDEYVDEVLNLRQGVIEDNDR